MTDEEYEEQLQLAGYLMTAIDELQRDLDLVSTRIHEYEEEHYPMTDLKEEATNTSTAMVNGPYQDTFTKQWCLDKAIDTFKTFDIGEQMVARDIVTLAMIYEAYLTNDEEVLDTIYSDETIAEKVQRNMEDTRPPVPKEEADRAILGAIWGR